MKKLKIVLLGLLIAMSVSFIGCKSNFETSDVQEESVDQDTGRYGFSNVGGVTC